MSASIDSRSDDDGGSNVYVDDAALEIGDVEEKRHNRAVEDFKNNSALLIVGVCLLAILLFAIIQFIWQGADGGDAMAKASDVFKLIATTALGFLFGRNSK